MPILFEVSMCSAFFQPLGPRMMFCQRNVQENVGILLQREEALLSHPLAFFPLPGMWMP